MRAGGHCYVPERFMVYKKKKAYITWNITAGFAVHHVRICANELRKDLCYPLFGQCVTALLKLLK
jgi:hypothetical protein